MTKAKNTNVTVNSTIAAKDIANIKLLTAAPQVLDQLPKDEKEYGTLFQALYRGEIIDGHSIGNTIPEDAERFYTIFHKDPQVRGTRYASRQEAEANAPDDSFYMVYENASKVFFQAFDAFGEPVGECYQNKFDAVHALIAYLKPELVHRLRTSAESK